MRVILSSNCSSTSSTWTYLSSSMLHLGAKINDGGLNLCMDWNTTRSHTVLSRSCVCLDGNDGGKCLDDPRSQWFKFIPADVD